MIKQLLDLNTFQRHYHLPALSAFRVSISEIQNLSADSDTRFPFASVTKTFTAHLCLQPDLLQYLDLPIQEVLPYFQLQDPEATRLMTARDALCHFSGLPPHTDAWVRCALSREAFIRDRLPHLEMAGPFREKHRYSNILYAVLGQWLEAISGSSWETQIVALILKPLEMTRTGFLAENWQHDAAPPHALSAQGEMASIPPFYARKNHLIAPASEMMGSMSDLALWGQFMLMLSPDDQRWQPHNLISEKGPLHYGLGWRLDTVNGEPRFWHSGQCSGYSTLLTLYPQRQIGLAAASNCSGVVEALQALDAAVMHASI